MKTTENSFAPVCQRWERPLEVPPGHWKKQLASKYLAPACRGDLQALRDLLADHPEFLNKRGPHNRTLLWEATRRGHLPTVQWLGEQGAEIDATGCYNSESYLQITPYCAAIYYHRPEVASYLHAQKPHLDIFRAAFVGDQGRVADELAAEPTLLHTEDPCDPIYFVPLLAFAVVGGQLEMLDFLLRRGATLQRGAMVAPYSAQLLHLAARDARMDMIELLLMHGADIRAVDTGIFGAVADLGIFRYLLSQGVSATKPGKNGFPPLIYVARGDRAECPQKVQILLEQGAAVNAIGPRGRSALHYAARGGHAQVSALLLAYGADLTLRDDQGMTALDLARAAGKSDVTTLLMQLEAVCHNKR